MARFTPCQGKQACRETEAQCLTCGRGIDEIVWLRDLIEQLTSLANDYHYDNIDDFSAYVADRLTKSIEHRRQQPATADG